MHASEAVFSSTNAPGVCAVKCSRTGRTASRQSLDGRLCCQRAVRDWVRMPEVSWFPPGLDRVQNPRPGGGSMETKEFQRRTAKRKVELLLQLIRGERKLVDVCREHDLKQVRGRGVDGHVRQGRGARTQGAGRGRAGGA